MDLRNYFAQAQDEANENFFNYDGYDEDFNFVDDEFDNFDGDDHDAFDMATGGGGKHLNLTLLPLLIQTQVRLFHVLS
jgi:hypothetical protein